MQAVFFIPGIDYIFANTIGCFIYAEHWFYLRNLREHEREVKQKWNINYQGNNHINLLSD